MTKEDAMASKPTTSPTDRKTPKPRLTKVTLKDLSVRRGDDVKGGARTDRVSNGACTTTTAVC